MTLNPNAKVDTGQVQNAGRGRGGGLGGIPIPIGGGGGWIWLVGVLVARRLGVRGSRGAVRLLLHP